MADRLRDQKRVSRILPGEIGEILILTPGLKYEEDIALDLKSLLGIKYIQVEGIRP